MISVRDFFIYLFIMSAVTYLVRTLPFVICKKKIENRFVQSFLYYVPYAVLGAMTFPAIFTSAGNICASLAGLAAGCVLAFFEKSLLTVAVSACAASFIVNLLMLI